MSDDLTVITINGDGLYLTFKTVKLDACEVWKLLECFEQYPELFEDSFREAQERWAKSVQVTNLLQKKPLEN